MDCLECSQGLLMAWYKAWAFFAPLVLIVGQWLTAILQDLDGLVWMRQKL